MHFNNLLLPLAAASPVLTTLTRTSSSPDPSASALAAAVKKLGLTLQTNAGQGGPSLAASELVVGDIDGIPGEKKHAIHWPHPKHRKYIDWKTYKSNGVNLGAWMEQEENFDVVWWAENVGNYTDEWTWCQSVGFEECGPKLEARYASFITTADIDLLGRLGVNTVRIATTYAAWAKVPGSWLYHGHQREYLRAITNYAIDKYDMHVILGLHSLPGGINSLDIGEAFGHNFWFQNVTNLEYSLRVFDSLLDFVRTSGRQQAFTLAPGNEFSNNLTGFATSNALTDDGVNWVNTWIQGCLARIAKVDKRIPLMLQDSFKSETFWSPFYPTGTNLVIDSHIYFFAVTGAYQQYVPPAVCSQAKKIAQGDGKFPVFVGEWSLQTLYNNTLAGRKTLYDTQVYTWQKYGSGGAFWNYKMVNTETPINGTGVLQDYWSWELVAEAGIPSAHGVEASSC